MFAAYSYFQRRSFFDLLSNYSKKPCFSNLIKKLNILENINFQQKKQFCFIFKTFLDLFIMRIFDYYIFSVSSVQQHQKHEEDIYFFLLFYGVSVLLPRAFACILTSIFMYPRYDVIQLDSITTMI